MQVPASVIDRLDATNRTLATEQQRAVKLAVLYTRDGLTGDVRRVKKNAERLDKQREANARVRATLAKIR
jgi:hypothetical protein